MPEARTGTGPAEEAGGLDSLRSRSEQAWQAAQAAWARAQEIQARQEQAEKDSLRSPPASLSTRLQAQLVSMPVVEQAKGVLMAQQGCDADQAYDLLCKVAERSGMAIYALAEQIIKKAQQRDASA